MNWLDAWTRRGRIGILLIVAALVWVPPLVRAAAPKSTSSPIRLNRGFERPPAKSVVAPPQGERERPIRLEIPEPARSIQHLASPDELLSTVPLDRAPDAQRGPPSLLQPLS